MPFRFIKLFSGVFIFLICGCVSTESRFERIENGQSVLLPMKLDRVDGVRDGDAVRVEFYFEGGPGSADLKIALRLTPLAEFESGTYRANFEGGPSTGMLESESLTFLGGQAGSPSVGGVFVFKDPQGRTTYRVRIPPTPIGRRPPI